MLFFFPFLQIQGFFATCTSKKITVRVKLGWKLFFLSLLKYRAINSFRITSFLVQIRVLKWKKLKKGGHCSNFTDYSTKIANNSRFKNHTDNSRNYAGIFRGGLITIILQRVSMPGMSLDYSHRYMYDPSDVGPFVFAHIADTASRLAMPLRIAIVVAIHGTSSLQPRYVTLLAVSLLNHQPGQMQLLLVHMPPLSCKLRRVLCKLPHPAVVSILFLCSSLPYPYH